MLLADAILGVLIGAALGSFISASAYRIPRGVSLREPSRCDSCGKPIPPWRNLPVLTWVIQRGKSSCCGEDIPASVLWVELSGALCGGAIGALLGVWGLAAITLLVLLGVPAASLALRKQTKKAEEAKPQADSEGPDSGNKLTQPEQGEEERQGQPGGQDDKQDANGTE